jgi:arabinose-5-phosphate isomerase
MLAVGDALALTVMQMRNFTPEDYAAFHPGGSLGRSLLLKVEEAMSFRVGDRLTVIPQQNNLGQALALAEQSGRRAGAMVIVDPDGVLTGILTDGDLRRLLLTKPTEDLLATPIRQLMVADPRRVRCGELASRALAIMNEYRIDELPVVDDAGKPAGLIDVQDLLGIQTLSHGK